MLGSDAERVHLLPFETFDTVLLPRVGAVRTVLAQLHPLVTELAKHSQKLLAVPDTPERLAKTRII